MTLFEVTCNSSTIIEAEDAEQAEFFVTEDLSAFTDTFSITEVKQLNG